MGPIDSVHDILYKISQRYWGGNNNQHMIWNIKKLIITFPVALLRLAFDPKTSFFWDWSALLCELDAAEDCEFPFGTSGFLSLDPEEETGGGEFFKGFPSKRLPVPVNGLNLGSVSAGASSTVRRNKGMSDLQQENNNIMASGSISAI